MKNNYRLRSYLFSIAVCLATTFNISAQVNTYAFSSLSGTFTPLSGGTQTSLAATDDDAMSAAFPIGFTFVYNGTNFTTVQASSNGQLLFGTGRTQTTANNLATTTATERPGVAPLWDDLQCTSGVSYTVTGVAPYRTLTVEWLNMEWNYQSNTGAISFQVQLNETTNIIDIIYRQESTAYSAGFTGGASIGIMGTTATDFISLADVTASPATSTTVSTNNIATKPATGQIYRFGPQPPTPGIPVQTPGAVTCSTGSTLTVPGTAPANTTWYWQTSATGTSTATPYSGPYSISANGTYYIRAFNSVLNLWSYVTPSVTVTNFPTATPPPAPVAAQSNVCYTTGTALTVAAAPAGYIYYWQGQVVDGSSTALNATAPYQAFNGGTYYVSAYETATQCWSPTVGVAITAQTTLPPAPTVPATVVNYCASEPNMNILATLPTASTTSCSTTSLVYGYDDEATTATVTEFNCGSGTVASITMSGSIQNNSANCGSWYDFDIIVNGATVASNQCAVTAFDLTPYMPLTSVSIVSNDIDGADYISLGLTVTVTYAAPVYTLEWHNTPAVGTGVLVGTGSPLNALGTSVLPTAATGSYPFYVSTKYGVCENATRTLVTVNVTEVLAVLTPINATCNGLNNGSFTLGAVQCGIAPFTYSVDGGAFVTGIPVNLSAGTHSIIMKDANMGTSAPISVVITQPTAPTGLSANNVTFYNATLNWVPQGNETEWIVEYGPTGFVPGTGTFDTTSTHPLNLTGLNPATTYQFYVWAGCSATSAHAGPYSFTTFSTFFTYDNACGPGFTDIAATGTSLVLGDDAEAGVTLPWSWNINGQVVTTITIGNNGGLLFNTLTGDVPTAPAGAGLYPYNQDLYAANAGGGVYYQSVGTAPNRQFIVEWKDLPHYALPVGTDGATFEVVVDEASGEVYFLYQDVMMSNTAWNNGADAEIRINTSNGNSVASTNSPTLLAGTSCLHFYNVMCPNPTNLSITRYAEEIQIDWDPSVYGEGNWTIIYGEEGFDPTDASQGTTEVTTISAISIAPLTQSTAYDIYIYSECAADDLTSPGLLVQATTPSKCSTVGPNPTATTDIDSLEAVWNWTINSQYPASTIAGFNIQYGPTGFTLGSGTIEAANGTNFSDTIHDAGLMAGGVYQFYVQAVCNTGTAGSLDSSTYVGPITFVMPLTNDAVCSPEALAVNGTTYTFNNTGGTVGTGESVIAPPAAGAQVTTGWTNSTLNSTTWFTFVAPASGNVRINNTAINYNGQAAVYRTTDCSSYAAFTLVAANDNAIGGTSVAPNFTICGLTPGSTYYLMHDAFNSTNGNYTISLTPIVLEAGTSLATDSICAGSEIDLFSTVTGNNAGGVWSSAIPSANINIAGSDFSSAGLAYQTFEFQYRMTDGCAYDSVLTHVYIAAPSNAGMDGTVNACRNEPIDLLAGLNGSANLNGTWYNAVNTALPNSQISASNTTGNYSFRYIAGNNVCPNDTANVVVVVGTCNFLGLDEAIFEGVSVYPNPSEGMVFISSDVAESFSYTVTDAKGRVVQKATNAVKGSQVTEINLSKVETGIYFIRLTNATAEKTFRVVIQ